MSRLKTTRKGYLIQQLRPTQRGIGRRRRIRSLLNSSQFDSRRLCRLYNFYSAIKSNKMTATAL